MDNALVKVPGIGELMIGVNTRRGSRPHFHGGYSIGIFHLPSSIWCRGEVRSVLPHQIVILEPGEVHGGKGHTGDCPQDGMVIDSATMLKLFGAERPAKFDEPVIDDQAITAEFSEAFRSSRRAYVERAISALFLRHGRQAAHSVRPAELAIKDQSFDLPVAAQAEKARLSRSYYSRKIVSTTGLSPCDHRRMQRVDTARLLIDQGLSLAEVAASAGFADQAHMTRQMRELCGVTPGALRRRTAW